MTIDRETLEGLLYMEEGPSLDFKGEQYRFSGARAEDKSKLLKDILAFANTPRTRTAYILIGVEEVNGGRSKVVGVDIPLEDASLQQFVNSKTNRPVEFSYSEPHIDGMSIGVISIPIQARPLYLGKKFGTVEANEVYIRHGSSTDKASPDEMPQWVEATRRSSKWNGVMLHGGLFTRLTMYTGVRSLREPEQHRTWDGGRPHYDFEGLAQELGVDPAMYHAGNFNTVCDRAMKKPLGLRFYNSGSVGKNVGFTGTLEAGLAAGFEPGTSSNNSLSSLQGWSQSPDRREIKVGKSGDGIQISVEVGHIRPGDYVWAGAGATFWTKETGKLMWEVRFVADNLPEPIEYEMPLRVEYEKRYIQEKDLESPFKRPDPRMLPYEE